MLGYTADRNLYGALTDNQDSANLTLGDTLINEGINQMLGDVSWPFLQTTSTASTVASQQTYTLPGNLSLLISVYILVGTQKYPLTEVTSFDEWNRLNNPTTTTGDNASRFFIQGNQIQFWPTPATSSNTITYEYLLAARDISLADYSTGTITTATNGSVTLTGSGTSWTAGMAGKYIRITSSNSANAGDGLWYRIATASSTSITLSAVYTGTSIAAGSAAYTIVDASVLPEKYQIGPVYFATAEYWRKTGRDDIADRYQTKYEETLSRMRHENGTKTSSFVIDDNIDEYTVNSNLNKQATP